MIVGVELIASCLALVQLTRHAANFIREIRTVSTEYREALNELEWKLRTFGLLLRIIRKTTHKIERSSNGRRDHADALALISESVECSRETLCKLVTCQGELKPPESLSKLKLAVKFWFNEPLGKSVVDRGLREIDGRLKYMHYALSFVGVQTVTDIRDQTSRPILSPGPSNEASGLRGEEPDSHGPDDWSRIDDDAKTICGPDDNPWGMEIFGGQSSVSGPSDLSPSLVLAIQRQDRSGVHKLLECGINPLAEDADGWCALHHAVKAGSKRVLRELLKADTLLGNAKAIDTRDQSGGTPLHFAALIGAKAMAKELLEAGADKDTVDKHRRSPLFLAAAENKEDIVELLLDHKAKVTANLPERFFEIQKAITYRKYMEAKKKRKR